MALIVTIVVVWAGLLIYNNTSFYSNADFARRIDSAIERAEKWVIQHKEPILKKKNTALLEMLWKCNQIRPNPELHDITKTHLGIPILNHSRCWNRMIDPNWPITAKDLNKTIERCPIDYKWMAYAMAPDMANVTAEQLDMFNPDRWQQRELIHQLYALLMLKNNKGSDTQLDKLILCLSNRLHGELIFDIAVVDIYIQKVAFVLKAGFPEKIRKRWIERIIANQQHDGGWNDRWFFMRSRRRPAFNFTSPPSDQHATIQALLALYLVRYQYPQQFNLKAN